MCYVADGDPDGDDDGVPSLGDGDGECDGDPEGEELGVPSLGEELGDPLGESLGEELGVPSLGDVEGDADGVPSLGDVEGVPSLGLVDGDPDGDADGVDSMTIDSEYTPDGYDPVSAAASAWIVSVHVPQRSAAVVYSIVTCVSESRLTVLITSPEPPYPKLQFALFCDAPATANVSSSRSSTIVPAEYSVSDTSLGL